RQSYPARWPQTTLALPGENETAFSTDQRWTRDGPTIWVVVRVRSADHVVPHVAADPGRVPDAVVAGPAEEDVAASTAVDPVVSAQPEDDVRLLRPGRRRSGCRTATRRARTRRRSGG